MAIERTAKIYEKKETLWPDGRREIVETKFSTVRPYTKERTVRPGGRKSLIPSNFHPQFEVVEAAILAGLEAAFDSQTGEFPQDLGGSDTSQNALVELNLANISDEKIAAEFLRLRASPEYRKDETAKHMVLTALQSIRSVVSASEY